MDRGRLLIFLAMILTVVGLVLHIVGLSTTHWTTYPENERGPYRFCSFGSCGETKGGDGNLDAVRAMVIIGMIFAVFAFGAMVALLYHSDVRRLPLAVLILTTLAFISILIAIIVWGAGVHQDYKDHQDQFNKVDPDLGYSFALSLVGGILIQFAGLAGYAGGRYNFVSVVY